MSYNLDDIKVSVSERGYSDNFSKAINALERDRLEKEKVDNERIIRITEISDFVSRTFDDHMLPYIKKHDNGYYFPRAVDFIEMYYPENYLSWDDISSIMKQYGIRNYRKFLYSDLFIITCVITFALSSFVYLTYTFELDIAETFLTGILCFVIACFLTLIVGDLLDRFLHMCERIKFSFNK